MVDDCGLVIAIAVDCKAVKACHVKTWKAWEFKNKYRNNKGEKATSSLENQCVAAYSFQTNGIKREEK